MCAAGILGDRKDQVPAGVHDRKLSHGAVRAVYTLWSAHPDLISIAHKIIVCLRVHFALCGRFVLQGNSQLHILLTQDPLAVPDAAVRIELHQPQIILRGGEQSAAAHFHAVRHMGPAQPFRIYTDLVKQSRLQIIMQSQSRFFAHDGSQQRGADAVVHVSRTRLILHGNRQKVPDPVNGRLRHLFHAAAHAQYVLHAQLLQVLRRRFWRLFRENINDPFFQRKNAFRVCDSHCRGGIGLCM